MANPYNRPPSNAGTYPFRPRVTDTQAFSPVEVVTYEGSLMAKLPTGDQDFEMHPVGDLDGDWIVIDDHDEADESREVKQAGMSYIVLIRGPGAATMTDTDRNAFESAFRSAFDKLCVERSWKPAAVVHAHSDFNEHVLDPREGGPGFFQSLHDTAVARMAIKPPADTYFHCYHNAETLVRPS